MFKRSLKILVIILCLCQGVYSLPRDFRQSFLSKDQILNNFRMQFSELTLDKKLSKFINDMDYMKVMLPLLINVNDSIMPTSQYASTDSIQEAPPFVFLDESLIDMEISDFININQHFTTIDEDIISINAKLDNSQLINYVSFDQFMIENLYKNDTVIPIFDTLSDFTYHIPSQVLFDSLSIKLQVQLPLSFDSIKINPSDSLIEVNSEQIHIVDYKANAIKMLIPSSLFQDYLGAQAITPTDKTVDLKAANWITPDNLANYKNITFLLDNLYSLVEEAKENWFDTDESFMNALEDIFEHTETFPSDKYFSCIFYFNGDIKSVILFFKKGTVSKEYELMKQFPQTNR